MATTDGELGTGTVLGGTYELVRTIGTGGMGSVWEARHLRLPRRVAIKLLKLAVDAQSELYLRFRREAEIASQLGHPHIVEVYDFDALDDGTPWLAMELLEGQTLRQRIRQGPPTLASTQSIVWQIASALRAAHRRGIVHRDLKPENIFLCRRELEGEWRDHVKVLDFGISKIRGSQTVVTQESAVIGTPQYMSPEQAAGKNDQVDARTDVFALAAITYEMLSGLPPFSGTQLAEVVFKVVYEPHVPLCEVAPDVPKSVVSAVERGLIKDREARTPNVEAFVAELTGRPMSLAESPAIALVGDEAAHALGLEETMASDEALASTLGSISEAAAEQQAKTDDSGIAASARTSWIAAGALVAGIALAWVGFRALEPEQAPAQRSGLAAPLPENETVDSDEEEAADPDEEEDQAVDEAELELEMETEKETASTAENSARAKVKRPSQKRAQPAALPEAVASDMAAARGALVAGDFDEALRLARRANRVQLTEQAFAIMVQAHCGQGDMTTARGRLRKVRDSKIRRRAVKGCQEHGIDL